MKNFEQYIYEAWGSNKGLYRYKHDLEAIFYSYETAKEKKEQRDKKAASGKSKSMYHAGPNSQAAKNPVEKLAKYPVQILIDKAGFTPKMIKKHYWMPDDKKNLKVEPISYGKFILDELDKGTFTKEDLINWWQEYEDNILKNKWCDIKWVIKQVDGSRFWSPWRPKDTSMVDALIDAPEKIITYVRSDSAAWYKMSEEERKEIQEFYADPVNHESLSKAIKTYRKQLEKLRPTNLSAASEIYKSILEDGVKVNGKYYKMEDALYSKEGGHQSYYSGSNDRDEYASAILSLITGAIKDTYGIGFDSYTDWKNLYDEWGGVKTYKNKFTTRGEDSKAEQFVEDADKGIMFEISDLGTSKSSGETGSVVSSSFWTYYKHNFEVKLIVGKDTVKYNKKINDVVTASSYYSGGWD